MGRADTPAKVERRLRWGIHYKVDWDKVRLISAVVGKEIVFSDVINIKPTNIRPHIEGTWISYRDLYDTAEKFGILPELMVDEEYYRTRVEVLVYRIAFEGLRKGMDLYDVYVKYSQTAEYVVAPETFIGIVAGRINTLMKLRLETLKYILDTVGLELADVFAPIYRRADSGAVPFRIWKTALSTLDEEKFGRLIEVTIALAHGREVYIV